MATLTKPAAFLLALMGLATPLAAARQASDPAEVAAFASLVTELARLEDGLDPETASQRVHALGTPAAPILFSALSRDELPRGEGALALGEREHRVLLQGARQIGREAFAPLWGEAASGSDPRRRRTAIELVGLVGRSGDLGTAVMAASPPAKDAAHDPQALPTLEEAVARLLTRDPGTLALLRPAILHAPPDVAGSLILAAANVPDDRTLELFADMLGLEVRLDLPILSQIARLTRGQMPPFEERLRARVRAYLADSDRQLVRAATMALAELQDEDALPLLVDLADGRDAALAGAAFLALERTTGLSLPRRADRWRSWLVVEQNWSTSEGPRISAALSGHDVPQTLAALRETSRHRLGRQQQALAIARLLGHEDPLVRVEACRTLQALASPVARTSLEQALQDDDAGVAAAAAAALRALGIRPVSSSDQDAGKGVGV